MGVNHGKTPFLTVQTEGLGNMKNQVTDLGLNVLLLLRLRALKKNIGVASRDRLKSPCIIMYHVFRLK